MGQTIPVDAPETLGYRPRSRALARSGAAAPAIARPQTAAETKLNPLVRWALYLFMATIPFEGLDLGPQEPTLVSAGLLILAALLQPSVCFRIPSRAFWFFAFYYYVCVSLGMLFGDQYRGEVNRQLLVHTQLMLLFWIGANLLRFERIARTALLTFIGACMLLSLLQLAGVTAGSSAEAYHATERVSAMGENPNTVARVLALALLAVIGLSYGAERSFIRPPVLAAPVFALIGLTIVQTGSRGGLMALGAGLLCFMTRGRSFAIKLRNMLVVLVGIGFFVMISYQTESMRNRFTKAIEEGNLAKRELIFPLASQMIAEKPIFGWGPINEVYELGARLRQPGFLRRDAHNLILAVLTKTGLVGFIPYLLGTILCVLTAWKSRAGPHGILPYAMMLALLVANMSGCWLFNKLHWLVMAYASAAAMHLHEVSGGVVSGEWGRRPRFRS